MRFKNVRRLCGALAALLLLPTLAGCGGSNGDSGSAAEAGGEELIPVKIGSPATGDHGARMLEAASSRRSRFGSAERPKATLSSTVSQGSSRWS